MTFEEFYETVHGYPPRAWQSDLAAQVVERGAWPEGVAAPTGAGKTSVLDIAVWHLVHQVMTGVERTAALRSVLTVERRLIVDEAGAHARKIASAVETDPNLSEVRSALRSLLPDFLADDPDEPTIMVTSMHGAVTWDRMWWRPVGCSIITGTVTQITSRVLFRGVGESDGIRRISAGVLGTDCVRFCDEPHLSGPAVRALREQGRLVGHRPPSTVVLGATVPKELRFEDSFVTGTMTTRRRPLTVVEMPAKESGGTNDREMAKEISRIALDRHAEGGEVVVIVSSTAIAAAVAGAISKAKVDVLTVTSRVRPVDRDAVGSIPKRDAIIVATQTLEVGVDYDARVLISDLAPLPSLIQRAGRAGRHGREDVEVVVVVPSAVTASYTPSYVYGEGPLNATAAVLLDGVESLDDITITDDEYDDTWVESARTVPLDDVAADLLENVYAVAPWEVYLHGPDHSDRVTVRVVWRDEPDLIDRVEPVDAECVSLPIQAVRSALNGRNAIMFDIEGSEVRAPGGARKFDPIKGAYVVSKGEAVELTDTADIVPGCTVALPSDAGLYDKSVGWDPMLNSKGTPPVWDAVRVTRDHANRKRPYEVPLAKVIDRDVYEAFRAGEEVELGLPDYMSIVPGGRTVRVTPDSLAKSEVSDGSAVMLADHLVHVAEWARDTSAKAGTSIDPEAFYRAGIHHDLGKVAPEFQRSRLGNFYDPQPWAKSRTAHNAPDELPVRWRHETVPAQLLREAGFTDEAWLVADHHGRGHVHVFDGSLVRQVADKVGRSPWDRAADSAVFRYADWMASASPKVLDRTMDDVMVDVVVFGYDRISPSFHEVGEATHVFDGVASQPMSGNWASFGAFADLVERCPDAVIRESSMGVFEVHAPGAGDVKWRALFPGCDFVFKKNGVIAGEGYPWWVSDDILAFTPKKPGDVRVPHVASVVQHGNSSVHELALRDDVSTAIFTDPDYGWDEAAKGGGFDVCDSYLGRNVMNPVHRHDTISWAMRGQWSLGAPQGENGAGVVDKVMTYPVTGEWRNFEESKFGVRIGLGHTAVKEQRDKMVVWIPVW